MNARSLPAFILAATWLAAPDARAEELQDRIAIAEIGDMFQVSLPVSRLVMTFPRGGFRVDLIDEETDGPHYFSFSDPVSGAMMTGWFEPADAYNGIETIREDIVSVAKKIGLPAPAHLEIVRIGRWEAVTYDHEMPPVSNAHIRAQWTELGTWIDLHISVTTAAPIESARKAAQDVLAGVQIAVTTEE